MTWRIFTMYMLLILFILLAGHVSAQVTVTHYNAEWNKANDVKWLNKLFNPLSQLCVIHLWF